MMAQPMDRAYSCGWDIVHACDYRCPYCFFLPSWASDAQRTNGRHLSCSREDWIGFWERCFEQLGPFRVEVAGGEPFCHPDLVPIVRAVSRRHTVLLVTNLSVDAQVVLDAFDPARVSLSASFHPSHARLDELLGKLSRLRSAGFSLTASIVAYPPRFAELEGWLDEFSRAGIPCFLNPFQGSFAGKDYPRAYSEGDAGLIRKRSFPDELPLRLRQDQPKGRLCAAGARYFRVWPDGMIFRCCAATELGLAPLGHIRDRVIPVAREPSLCPAERCFAPNEVACLL